MPTKTIVDASVANAGRVYDYLLGGHHNFEIDRRAGDQLRELAPFLPKIMRLFRWCIQDLAYTLTYERGYDTIIDFASGLPTEDHLHSAAAPGTTIIYSDRDPVCVEYGREILGSTPNVYYLQADCRYPEQLLNRPDVQEILNGKRHVACIYWGISMYLTDDEIRHIVNILYDWTDATSTLAIYMQPGDIDNEEGKKIQGLYRSMGDELQFRSLDTFRELYKPWVADKLGYRTMEDWHALDSQLSQQDIVQLAGNAAGYGVYLVKGTRENVNGLHT